MSRFQRQKQTLLHVLQKHTSRETPSFLSIPFFPVPRHSSPSSFLFVVKKLCKEVKCSFFFPGSQTRWRWRRLRFLFFVIRVFYERTRLKTRGNETKMRNRREENEGNERKEGERRGKEANFATDDLQSITKTQMKEWAKSHHLSCSKNQRSVTTRTS